MNTKSFAWSVVLALFLMTITVASTPEWKSLHHVKKSGDGFVTTGADPWMISAPFDPAVPAVNSCLLVEMVTSKAIKMEVRWWNSPQPTYHMDRTLGLRIPASSQPVTRVIDLGMRGKFDGARAIRIDPGPSSGLKFQITKLQLVPIDRVPLPLVSELMEFCCYTSKLHYQPGQSIEYQAAFVTRAYPDRQSSKILEVKVLDAGGRTVAKSVRQYGIHAFQQWKVISGRIDLPQPLGPGKYRLQATSTDQRSSFVMTADHDFGIQGPDDPFLYETPFKFVKDFSVIKGPDNRWHVFSITGDFFGNHDWMPDGQERTFSHASSTNLRDWTIHPPVISISNRTYPDGRGRFKNRNVWAPHVIKHQGKYWMFYTSVNEHVSQSVSLATSQDLFEWVECETNPVFTLEDVAWAKWDRQHWANCRDPVVLDDGGEFYLYVTASVEPPGETGAVVVAKSDDLIRWRQPAVAVRGRTVSESPQVWKNADTYWMTTSSKGADTYSSKHPVKGWQRTAFGRPDIKAVEKYVTTSGSYAEEVVSLNDGTHLMAALTYRHYGNSIYFFRIQTDDAGRPTGYKSPF